MNLTLRQAFSLVVKDGRNEPVTTALNRCMKKALRWNQGVGWAGTGLLEGRLESWKQRLDAQVPGPWPHSPPPSPRMYANHTKRTWRGEGL